jgi:hypothetical protein
MALLVVLHTPPTHDSRQPIRAGRLSVAPPNDHLTVEHAALQLVQGPTENSFRPAALPHTDRYRLAHDLTNSTWVRASGCELPRTVAPRDRTARTTTLDRWGRSRASRNWAA